MIGSPEKFFLYKSSQTSSVNDTLHNLFRCCC
jgi:hypothetical protein